MKFSFEGSEKEFEAIFGRKPPAVLKEEWVKTPDPSPQKLAEPTPAGRLDVHSDVNWRIHQNGGFDWIRLYHFLTGPRCGSSENSSAKAILFHLNRAKI